jgi:hypothetical protein
MPVYFGRKHNHMSNSYSPALGAPSDIPLDTLVAYLRDIASQRFFGTIHLSYQSGQLQSVRAERTLKSADLTSLVKGNPNARSSQ